ncbi:hypothetical protein ACES2L_10430 [Bdellovibrio bacteriovorus]
MAKNPPPGDSRRQGAVKKRSQVENPRTGHFTKRDADTGEFVDQKRNSEKFKGVRKEK